MLLMTLLIMTILAFIMLPYTFFSEITPLDASTMEARVFITNTVTLEPTGPGYRVDELEGALSWFPRDYPLQTVMTFTTEPHASRSDGFFMFSWSDPKVSNDLTVQSTIKTRNAIIPVRERIPFPITDVPQSAALYLGEGEIIDQSPEIRELAQELAAGKTDAYEVVFALADWTTRNVNYSLASLGAPASQRSSQVLMSRYGKCDELTSLFISMNRALGIPARFAAGYSYTNSDQFRKGWGGHGWAEVWFPEYGWVPFDVTYGEYGYLDAGHVLLKISPDAKENSIDYNARGLDFDMRTESLDIVITPTNLVEKREPEISLSLNAPVNLVGFGSTVLILATVENKRDYYVSTRLDLAKTTNTDMLSTDYENILLHPRETRTFPFLLKIDDDLQQGFLYEFPFRLHSMLGEDATMSISVQRDAPYYDRSAFDAELARYAQDAVDPVDFSVTCDQGTPSYPGKTVLHSCVLKGASTVEICGVPCKDPVRESGDFTLQTIDDRAGVFTRTYTARALGQQSSFFVTSRTIAPPNVSVVVVAPASATPDDAINAVITIDSDSELKDVRTAFMVRHATATQNLDTLDRPAKITFSLTGGALRPGTNTLDVTVTYKDELGTAYTKTATGSIELTGVTALDRVEFAFEDFGYWLSGIFS